MLRPQIPLCSSYGGLQCSGRSEPGRFGLACTCNTLTPFTPHVSSTLFPSECCSGHAVCVFRQSQRCPKQRWPTLNRGGERTETVEGAKPWRTSGALVTCQTKHLHRHPYQDKIKYFKYSYKLQVPNCWICHCMSLACSVHASQFTTGKIFYTIPALLIGSKYKLKCSIQDYRYHLLQEPRNIHLPILIGNSSTDNTISFSALIYKLRSSRQYGS